MSDPKVHDQFAARNAKMKFEEPLITCGTCGAELGRGVSGLLTCEACGAQTLIAVHKRVVDPRLTNAAEQRMSERPALSARPGATPAVRQKKHDPRDTQGGH